MRYLTLGELIELHRHVIERYGGPSGLRDLGALESAVARPRMTSGEQELHPSLAEKAAVLAFTIVAGHPFTDATNASGPPLWRFSLSSMAMRLMLL